MKKSTMAGIGAAAVLAMAALAAGCGSSSDSATGTSTDTTATTTPASTGGTARYTLASDVDYTDPALAYYSASWNIEYATCAKLLNYPDTAGIAGATLQPEVAESMPTVSNGDKTYTFTVRDGFKFSPPSGAAVTAMTFKKVIERDLSKAMNSPAQSFAGDIVGAKEFTAGTAKELSGVKVDGNKISITLVKPAPDFLSRIAMPFFCAVPENTPINPNGVVAPAAAGPYYIKSRTPSRQIVLAKNPNYGGDRKTTLDGMIFNVGEPATAALLDAKSDKVDWIADGLPPTAHQELARDYGPTSQAAKDGKQRYFVNPSLSFRYLALNTSRPLFSNLKLRQAVQYAINRPALLAQRGASAGQPTDQYLPPGVPGYVDENIYPINGPDLKKAKELAGDIHEKAIMYTCDQSPCPETAAIVKENLKAIGIDVEVRQFARAIQFSKEGTKGEPFDIAFEGWQADYPDPYDFLNVLLDGRTIKDANNVNFSYLDDPAVNAKLDAAAATTGSDRTASYAKLDAELVRDVSPLVAWGVDNDRDFFSSKVGCILHHAVYGIDIATMCKNA
jgi:ABC-type oligopeptide transport system substrate-binding subunit